MICLRRPSSSICSELYKINSPLSHAAIAFDNCLPLFFFFSSGCYCYFLYSLTPRPFLKPFLVSKSDPILEHHVIVQSRKLTVAFPAKQAYKWSRAGNKLS